MDQPTMAGRLLVAAPMLQEDSFRRSVVFVVDDTEEGTLGVILNRPLGLPVADVVIDWGAWASEPAVMFSGGPVGTGSGIALGVRGPDGPPPGWSPLEGVDPASGPAGIGVVDLDDPAPLSGTFLGGFRVFVGYAGWGAGQLAGEIDEGAWYVLDAVVADVFTTDPGRLWSRVLRRQGGDLALLSTYPDDPAMN